MRSRRVGDGWHAQCTLKRNDSTFIVAHGSRSYQDCSLLGELPGFSRHFLSFINRVFNITVSSEGCRGIERDVLSLIQDSVRLDREKNFRKELALK